MFCFARYQSQLRDALRDVWTNDIYRTHAACMAESLRAAGGLERAIQLLTPLGLQAAGDGHLG